MGSTSKCLEIRGWAEGGVVLQNCVSGKIVW
jgi:hypothetical protein